MRRTVFPYPDPTPFARRSVLQIALCGALLILAGCRATGQSVSWHEPVVARPRCSRTVIDLSERHRWQSQGSFRTCRPILSEHEWFGADADPTVAFEAAEAAYASGHARHQMAAPDCVDFFFETVVHSWCYLDASITSQHFDARYSRGWQLYHSGLAKLIETGQQYGRFDPSCRLLVNTSSGPLTIPVVYHGFVWHPRDFGKLVLVGDYSAPELSHAHQCQGLGVPLVVVRQQEREERFHGKRQHFAATAILRPRVDAVTASDATSAQGNSPDNTPNMSGLSLEFYDPLRVPCVQVAGRKLHLNTDTTAPFALLLDTLDRNYLQEFLQPGRSSGETKLLMLEPYQPGKIPLVFVHGLLSDPLTWVELANEIRAHPHLVSGYQIWAFKYPTGEPFLRSAARLRTELRAALDTLDPQRKDPALSQTVLVGHSMGGLISRLQVTWSGDTVWNSVASRPLEEIVATPQQRERLREMFFFEPEPCVKRVVFIGTPHNGSSWANRLVGRLGARLVRQWEGSQADHQQLIDCNPNTFVPYVRERIPSSIDMLEPDNPILASLQRLCVNPKVKLHSIIGTGRPMFLSGPADGVVPVASARQSGVETELFVPANHGKLHRHPDTVGEIICILSRHLANVDSTTTMQTSVPAGTSLDRVDEPLSE